MTSMSNLLLYCIIAKETSLFIKQEMKKGWTSPAPHKGTQYGASATISLEHHTLSITLGQ